MEIRLNTQMERIQNIETAPLHVPRVQILIFTTSRMSQARLEPDE